LNWDRPVRDGRRELWLSPKIDGWNECRFDIAALIKEAEKKKVRYYVGYGFSQENPSSVKKVVHRHLYPCKAHQIVAERKDGLINVQIYSEKVIANLDGSTMTAEKLLQGHLGDQMSNQQLGKMAQAYNCQSRSRRRRSLSQKCQFSISQCF